MDIVDLQIDGVGHVSRPDDRLRALPRPQVRPHSHQRLLRLGGHLSEHADDQGPNGWLGRDQPGDAARDPRPVAPDADELQKWEERVAALKTEQRTIEAEQKRLKDRQEELKKLASNADSPPDETDERTAEAAEKQKAEAAELNRQLQDLGKQSKKLQARLTYTTFMKPTLPQAYAAEDEPYPDDAHIALRGNAHNPGDTVPRGVLQAVKYGPSREFAPRGSGRKELADWIAHEDNPLTARVYVNRLWHHLFGAGIVPTVDNFGTRGEAPSHPELLDYLAGRLVANGWSTKKTIRELLLSHAYQMSSEHDDAANSADPDNRLLWRANRRRLEAEVIRDTILQSSGRLDHTRGGPTLPITEENLFLTAPFFLEDSAKLGDDLRFRRSVYMPILRGSQVEGLDILNLFDFADPDQIVGASSTTVPTQALFLMNAPFVKDEARELAERLLKDEQLDDDGRVAELHLIALSRPATKADIEQSREFLSKLETSLRYLDPPSENPRRDAWTRFCHSIFASAEFLYRR